MSKLGTERKASSVGVWAGVTAVAMCGVLLIGLAQERGGVDLSKYKLATDPTAAEILELNHMTSCIALWGMFDVESGRWATVELRGQAIKELSQRTSRSQGYIWDKLQGGRDYEDYLNAREEMLRMGVDEGAFTWEGLATACATLAQ